MEIFELLKANKGTVSSALGKELGAKVLNGDMTILEQAMKYVVFHLNEDKSKGIRAGAAKIIEVVAEKKPELIAKDLDKLKPALNVSEPQTRWMLMCVFGFCAKLNPTDSISVVDYAKKYLTENAGVCLSGAVHQYLGRIGATSEKTAMTVLPILDDSLKTASENEIDWILEGFISIVNVLNTDSLMIVKRNAEIYLDSRKKSTQDRAKKILKKIKKETVTVHQEDENVYPGVVTVHPKVVTGRPNDVTVHPKAVNDRPSNVNVHPKVVTDHPSDVTVHPNDVTVRPRDVNVHPGVVTVHPKHVTQSYTV